LSRNFVRSHADLGKPALKLGFDGCPKQFVGNDAKDNNNER
jgi:hypothetical protein